MSTEWTESFIDSVSTSVSPASRAAGGASRRCACIVPEGRQRPRPGCRSREEADPQRVAAMLEAKACFEAALQELSASIGKAQANLSSAEAGLRNIFPANGFDSLMEAGGQSCKSEAYGSDTAKELRRAPTSEFGIAPDALREAVGARDRHITSRCDSSNLRCGSEAGSAESLDMSDSCRAAVSGGACHPRVGRPALADATAASLPPSLPPAALKDAFRSVGTLASHPPITHASLKDAFPSVGSEASVRVHPSDEHQRIVTVANTTSHDSIGVHAETLPETWPTSLEIRWQVHRSGSLKSKTTLSLRRSSQSVFKESFEDEPLRARRPWYVIHPSSRGRMFYDLVSALLFAFDLFVIPLAFAWDLALVGGLYIMQWMTAVFWSVDIGVNMITAFHIKDECIVDLCAIVSNYLRSWFVPDLLIVLCDWVTLLVLSSSSWRTFRLAKIGRLLRLMALLRLLKLTRVIWDFIEENLSHFTQVMLRFVRMMLLTLVYSHILCCIWFFIGRQAPSDTGMRWLDSRDIAEENLWYQYATSLHWAMSQMTLGAMEIPSSTIVERLYSILCLLIGLLFGSTLVSTLSAAMLETQIQQQEPHLKMQQMRRFLHQHKVDSMLASRVERQLAERLATRDKIKEEQVTGLGLLSSSLRSELRAHMMAPYLKRHPLFHLWMDVDIRFMNHFCKKCMDFVHLRTQDDLFTAGKVAECTYFFVQGRMIYVQEPESSPMIKTTACQVQEGTWIAEAGLWSHWIHVGTARATRFCEVARVNFSNIMEIMVRTTTVMQLSMDYCQKFHRRLQAAKPPALHWPDDLQVPLTEWSEMVPAMDMESQVIIGLETIRRAAARLWLKASHRLDKLTEEVKAGKSTLMTTGDGEIERVVCVVALKIITCQGWILVQVGKQSESGELRPVCQLPGTKPDRGELVTDTMGRLLDAWVSPIADSVEVDEIERVVEWQQSSRYGVRTKYLRHIVVAKVASEPARQHLGVADAKHDFAGTGAALRRATTQDFTLSMTSRVFTQDSADARRMQVLKQRKPFCVEDEKGGLGFVAWLREHEFSLVRGPISDSMIAEWSVWLQSSGSPVKGGSGAAHTSESASRPLSGWGSEVQALRDQAPDIRLDSPGAKARAADAAKRRADDSVDTTRARAEGLDGDDSDSRPGTPQAI